MGNIHSLLIYFFFIIYTIYGGKYSDGAQWFDLRFYRILYQTRYIFQPCIGSTRDEGSDTTEPERTVYVRMRNIVGGGGGR